MHGALFNPLGDRRPLLVIRKMLRQCRGVKLQLAAVGAQRVFLRIFVEFAKSRRIIPPVLSRRIDPVFLLFELLPGNQFFSPHVAPNLLLHIENGETFGERIIQFESLGDFDDRLEIAFGLPDGFDGLVGDHDVGLLGPLSNVGNDIVHFHIGVDGQDNVGIDAVVFQPGMLGDDKFDLGIAHGQFGFVAAVPASDPAGGVGPHHVNFTTALFLGNGIGVFVELIHDQCLDGARAVKGDRLV
jgi:hypothetical protein